METSSIVFNLFGVEKERKQQVIEKVAFSIAVILSCNKL